MSLADDLSTYLAETAAAIERFGELASIDLDRLREGLLSTLRLEVGGGLMRAILTLRPGVSVDVAAGARIVFCGPGWDSPSWEVPVVAAADLPPDAWRLMGGETGAVGMGEARSAADLRAAVTNSLVLLGLVER
ncbi:MAG TPA: hypothetical protein DCY40_05015 [Actinobacteria bacterium]|nr:hypothetical protein [Actinomycetota bacterium]